MRCAPRRVARPSGTDGQILKPAVGAFGGYQCPRKSWRHLGKSLGQARGDFIAPLRVARSGGGRHCGRQKEQTRSREYFAHMCDPFLLRGAQQ